MQISSFGLSDPGPAGKRQEDAFLCDDTKGLYIVSDGIGSTSGADVASRAVVDAAWRAMLDGAPIAKAGNAAARALDERAKAQPALSNMAATLTMLRFSGARFEGSHVGDSRAYLCRGGTLVQLTRDHSVAFEQYLAGAISKDQIRKHKNQSHLTRAVRVGLGFSATDPFGGETKPRDTFLLCTDGLTKELSDADIVLMLGHPDPPEAIATALHEEVKRRIPVDNVTIVVVCVT